MLRRSTVWWHLISNFEEKIEKLSFADRQRHHAIAWNVCQLWLNVQIWHKKDKLGVRIYNVWKSRTTCTFPTPHIWLLFVTVSFPISPPVTVICGSTVTQPHSSHFYFCQYTDPPPLHSLVFVSVYWLNPPPVSVSWPSSIPVPQNKQNQVLFHFVYAVLTISFWITVCNWCRGY